LEKARGKKSQMLWRVDRSDAIGPTSVLSVVPSGVE